jgi:hypothetical protein
MLDGDALHLAAQTVGFTQHQALCVLFGSEVAGSQDGEVWFG